MSGAHDQARDAARVLLEAVTSGDQSLFLDYYDAEIKTVAEYLGVNEDEGESDGR